MFFALPARAVLLLWLGLCAIIGLLFGWPVIVGSILLAVGPTYLSMQSHHGIIAFPVAAVGALAGALSLTSHGLVASVLISLLTGFVVGLGLSLAAMWLNHRRTCACRSA